ncbi:MAG: acyl-CoA synthetase [Acidimicrobiales bacterium]|jgi:acyl-CoA synthetase (AMP-forming)/AMP-acid ligase II|nr:acyl-CoA synthetase [Acidimicrobiales bacterium]
MTGTFNLADLFESVVDVVPERLAVSTPARDLTFAELDERANRLARHLLDEGVGPGDHVALLLRNGTEYLEATFAAFKIRAVPVNVNYRYVERELQYLFDNADAVAVVVHREFAPRVDAVREACPTLRHVVVIDDDSDAPAPERSVSYEHALAGSSPERPAGHDRRDDDLYIAYTGGTTGLPKGVMWRHDDLFFAALGGGDPSGLGTPIADPSELPGRVPEVPGVQIQAPPLMHVSALWGSLGTMLCGNTAVLLSPGRFDPYELLGAVERHSAMICVLVGDAMARPLADAIGEAKGSFDLSSLFVVASGGAVLSPAVRDALRAELPNLVVVDGFGSSETGVAGTKATMGGETTGNAPSFHMGPDTTVLDEDDRPVEPGSGVIGRLARKGRLPLGYYKDEEKSRATFVEIGGERWVLPGDMATIEADGAITVLGRGSVSINTGGEKVFPEEVESVLKAHPDVFDTIVIGVPDERWGRRVVAVASPRGERRPKLGELHDHCAEQLAGYKIPREVVWVDEVERNPNGKPDYAWATRVVEGEAAR